MLNKHLQQFCDELKSINIEFHFDKIVDSTQGDKTCIIIDTFHDDFYQFCIDYSQKYKDHLRFSGGINLDNIHESFMCISER